MARRHWLDPLARRLLLATGQLPATAAGPASDRPAEPTGGSGASRAEPSGASAQPQTPSPTTASDHDAAVEQELLALKLAQNPALRLRDAGEVRHAAALGWRLEVNRASGADWLRLPGISPDQANLLLQLQQRGVQLSGPDDLQQRLQLEAMTLAQWLPLLDFSWYDSARRPLAPPPPDLNRAGARELAERLPILEEERRRRLLGERRRQPFANLADLQKRLQLPSSLVEQLIGRVRFGPAGPAAGPDLPRPATRREGR